MVGLVTVRTGGVVSTVKYMVVVFLLPAVSLAVMVMVLAPSAAVRVVLGVKETFAAPLRLYCQTEIASFAETLREVLVLA